VCVQVLLCQYHTKIDFNQFFQFSPGIVQFEYIDTNALVEAADGLPWQRVREITLPTLEDFDLLRRHHSRTRWNLWWRGFDEGRLMDLVPTGRRHNVTVLLAPDDLRLYDKLVLAESQSLQVAIPLTEPDCLDLDVFNSIISDVLVTDTTRQVVSEPMASMVNTARGRDDLTLWNFAEENVHRNVWVGDAGQVSLSARLARSHPYGSWQELDLEDMEGGSSYQRLEAYAEALFVSRSDCATCRAYTLCGGWLRYVDRGYDCDGWQRVLNALQDAVGQTERARILSHHR